MSLSNRVLITTFAIFAVTSCATADQGGYDASSTQEVDASSNPTADATTSCGTMCDEDDDGVPDSNDQCPATPAGEPVNQAGCAESQLTPMLEPEFPPFGLTWVSSGDLGRAGGLTWTYTAISRGDRFHIYWILCDAPDPVCGLSLDGPIDSPSESWQYSAADSDLPNGVLVFTSAPDILLAGPTLLPLSGRLTLTVTDLADVPMPVADVTALGVPPRLGQAGVEITGTNFKVNMLAEVQDGTTGWMPYLDYYDAAPTPDTGDTVYMSISGSFYSE